MRRAPRMKTERGRSMISDDTRLRLLDAARDVFAESGYYNATVRDISMRAGVNVAAINYHFGDKLELYTEVLRQSFPPSIGKPSAACSTRTPLPRRS